MKAEVKRSSTTGRVGAARRGSPGMYTDGIPPVLISPRIRAVASVAKARVFPPVGIFYMRSEGNTSRGFRDEWRKNWRKATKDILSKVRIKNVYRKVVNPLSFFSSPPCSHLFLLPRDNLSAHSLFIFCSSLTIHLYPMFWLEEACRCCL